MVVGVTAANNHAKESQASLATIYVCIYILYISGGTIYIYIYIYNDIYIYYTIFFAAGRGDCWRARSRAAVGGEEALGNPPSLRVVKHL